MTDDAQSTWTTCHEPLFPFRMEVAGLQDTPAFPAETGDAEEPDTLEGTGGHV